MISKLFSLKRNLPSTIRPENSRYPFVDILRGVSVLWVMLFHSYYFLGFLIPKESFYIPDWGTWGLLLQGHLALDVFLVLSGFLISDILFKELHKTGTLSLKDFYIKRAFRILPAYYIFLFLLTYISPRNAGQVWANIIYINNFLPGKEQFMPWAWSLALEEQFYIILPLILLILFKCGLSLHKMLWAFLGLSVILRGMAVIPHYLEYGLPPFHSVMAKEGFALFFDNIYDKFHTRFGPLVLGVLVGYYWNHRPKFPKAKTSFVLGFLLFVIILAINPHKNYGQFLDIFYFHNSRLLFSVGISLMLWGSLFFSFKRINWLHKITYPFAQLSYGVYLIHPVAMSAVYRLAQKFMKVEVIDSLWFFPLHVVIGFSLSLVMYLLIEKPFLNLRSLIYQRKKTEINLTQIELLPPLTKN